MVVKRLIDKQHFINRLCFPVGGLKGPIALGSEDLVQTSDNSSHI